MYACIPEIGGGFFGRCAGKRIDHFLFATHPSRRREPRTTTMEYFKGRMHLKLGGIDASAVCEREHWRGVTPKGTLGLKIKLLN
jgi:hypothetical protein